MKRIYLFFIVFLCLSSGTFAQKTISGKVTDGRGSAVSNASVIVKGTKAGTSTDESGNFSIQVPAQGNILVFSSINYSPREIPINGKSIVNAALEPIEGSIEEVVVVAYGTVKKGDFTGSANQVTNKDFENRAIFNPLNAIVGTGPGVQTTAAGGSPGSSPGIRIRGFGSINAGSGPLFVVDGVPYDGGIANLNSDDIETITTLKDAATTALWGSRAANGVIAITTKKGRKGKGSLHFKVTTGYSDRGLPEYKRVDALQYYPLMWEAYKNSLVYPKTGTAISEEDARKIATGLFPRITSGANKGFQLYNGKAYADISQQLGYNPFNVGRTEIVGIDGKLNPNASLLYGDDLDWTKDIIRTGQRQSYDMSYGGATDNTDYFGSVGYIKEKGFLLKSDYDRFTGRLNVNTNPVTWFKTGVNLSVAINNSNQANDGSSTGYVNPFFFSRNIGPIYPLYAHDPISGEYLLNANGERFYDYGNQNDSRIGFNRAPGGFPGRHIAEETKNNINLFTRNTISGRTYGSIIFNPWIKFTSNIAVDITDYIAKGYDNRLVGDGAPAGRANQTASKTKSYTFNQLIDFNKPFGKHTVSATLGHENYALKYDYLYVSKQEQILDGNIQLTNFTTVNSTNSRQDNYTIESYFGRLNYDYNGKYFLSANARRDGNSRFNSDVRHSTFFGIGGAWRIDREDFFKNVSLLNTLKLRASYGELGNDDIDTYYAYQAFYKPNNNALTPGFTQDQLANPTLTWEKNANTDVGLEFAMLKSRIRGSIEYYNRESIGLIFSVALPTSVGGFNVPTNIGNMINRGLELEIAADVIKSKDFMWTLKINASTLKNEITKMPPSNPEQINGTKKLSVGHSIYDYWLRESAGVDPADGSALYRADKYVATDKNIRIFPKGDLADTLTTDYNNARYHYTGSAIPKLFGGIENTLSYKGFELNVLVQYQLGGKVYDGTYASLMNSGSYGGALHEDALNRWQKPGDITNVPRLDNGRTGSFDVASDRWLIDASFLNIRSASISYKIPASWSSRIKASSATVFVNAENLKLFSKRYGMNVNQSFSGTTSNSYTPARIFTGGINITF